MKTVSPLLLLICFLISGSCISQQTMAEKEQELVAMYDRFSMYLEKDAEERDSLLNAFKIKLLTALKAKEAGNYSFQALSEKLKITTSGNGKLRIFSWLPYPDGCYRVYHAVYQYNDNGTAKTGELKADPGNEYTADIEYVGVSEIVPDNFILMGYGNRCGAQDFYTLRSITFAGNDYNDCRGCFAGEDALVFIKPRAVHDTPQYHPQTQTISYPEYIENIDTGFYSGTGNRIVLQYNKKIAAFTLKEN